MTEIKKPESCSHCSKIVQIGNPILRKPATKVENNSVKSDFVQDTVKKLETAIDNYDAVGLAAPQVGIDLKIACVQVTATQLQSHAYENIKELEFDLPEKRTIRAVWESSPWVSGGERFEFEYFGKNKKFGRKLNLKDGKLLFNLFNVSNSF